LLPHFPWPSHVCSCQLLCILCSRLALSRNDGEGRPIESLLSDSHHDMLVSRTAASWSIVAECMLVTRPIFEGWNWIVHDPCHENNSRKTYTRIRRYMESRMFMDGMLFCRDVPPSLSCPSFETSTPITKDLPRREGARFTGVEPTWATILFRGCAIECHHDDDVIGWIDRRRL